MNARYLNITVLPSKHMPPGYQATQPILTEEARAAIEASYYTPLPVADPKYHSQGTDYSQPEWLIPFLFVASGFVLGFLTAWWAR